MSTTVGIVVLNWNGGAQTIACLESLRAQDYRERFIVLVDNQSRPEERAELLRRYSDGAEVQCCWLDENRGYAGGCNAGVALALSRHADLVAVVTQDVTFADGALATLVAAADDPRVGIVGPKVVDMTDPQRVLSVGERIHVPLLCVPRTWLRYRRARQAPYQVGGVLGCAMLLTRRCLETVGGFDEALFAYYEEVDYCLRARRHGFLIDCAPQAVVRHDGMRGFAGGFSTLSAELKARNLIRLMRYWARPADYLLLAPTYALLLAGSMLLYAARRRFDVLAALLRGTMQGLQGRGGLPESLRTPGRLPAASFSNPVEAKASLPSPASPAGEDEGEGAFLSDRRARLRSNASFRDSEPSPAPSPAGNAGEEQNARSCQPAEPSRNRHRPSRE